LIHRFGEGEVSKLIHMVPRTSRQSPLLITVPLLAIATTALLTACQSQTHTATVITPSRVAGVPSQEASASAVKTVAPVNSAAPVVSGSPAQLSLFNDLPRPPDGAAKWTGAGGIVGILTPDQLIDIDVAPAYQSSARINEQQRRLQYAVRVNWSALDGTYADTYIAHFAGSAGAAAFYQGHVAPDASTLSMKGSFALPGVPHSLVRLDTKPDSDGNTVLVGYVLAGLDVVKLETLTPKAPDKALAIKLLTQEYRNLVAATH